MQDRRKAHDVDVTSQQSTSSLMLPATLFSFQKLSTRFHIFLKPPMMQLVQLLTVLLLFFVGSESFLHPAATSKFKNGIDANKRIVKVSSSAFPSFQPSGNNNTVAVPPPTQQQQRPSLNVVNWDSVKKSSVAGLSCVSTWLLARHGGLSVIQASGLQGLVGSVVFSSSSPAYAVASFCGSFAGMSGHATTLSDCICLGGITSLVYYLASGAWAGKGGRLGTLAFLANTLYLGLFNKHRRQILTTSIVQGIEAIGPVAASVMAATFCFRQVSKTYDFKKHSGNTSINDFIVKATLFATLAIPIILNSSNKGMLLINYVQSVLTMFGAGLFVSKSPGGIVLPASLVGMVAPTQPAAYLGAFMGMTTLPIFTKRSMLLAASLSSLLLQTGILTGFGGKLGLLAFLGVSFAL